MPQSFERTLTGGQIDNNEPLCLQKFLGDKTREKGWHG